MVCSLMATNARISMRLRIKSDFFKNRFEGVIGPQVRLDNVIFNSISESDNEMLVGSFSKEEGNNAVWSCDSSKSPGPDDFNFSLTNHSWDLVKQDIFLR